jgi:hypothetical protein
MKMFKKLWKLVRSDEKVMQALEQTSVSYDLCPDAPSLIPANNNAPAPAQRPGESRLWLDDWSERDEERVNSKSLHWEGYNG